MSLTPVEIIRLFRTLTKMVDMQSISDKEKEDMLHKAGCSKQEDGTYIDQSGVIYRF